MPDEESDEMYFYRVADSSALSSVTGVLWSDGRANGVLGEDEILLPVGYMRKLTGEAEVTRTVGDILVRLYGEESLAHLEGGSVADAIRQTVMEKYFTENFAARRDELILLYQEENGEGTVPSDEELKKFWMESLADADFVFEQHLSEEYAVFLTELTGEDYTEAKDLQFYRHVIENAFSVHDGKIFTTAEQIANLLTNRQITAGDGFSFSTFDTENRAAVLLFRLIDDTSSLFDAIRFYENSWDENGEHRDPFSAGKVVGFFTVGGDTYADDLIIGNAVYNRYISVAKDKGYAIETVAPHESGIYAFAIAPMPTDRATIEKLVELSYADGEDLRFALQNQVMDTLGSFNEIIEIASKVFFWIAFGFAVFASLMLMNFISVSISYKKREIGILRAVGARSSDVFKIFFSEAAIIALINYVLSLITTVIGVIGFNWYTKSHGINVTLLHFGFRQIILMLLVSAAVAAIASFLPVWNIARRKPVDAIKDK